ncbi:hypothetical protein CBR_g23229 [Chara braunii]|uniref:Integrase catalytic domain-containing protein n=1 Tax=Chara braunii TaxID=69332 RepID=A0A388JV69_CHABU|nr:hypothetical protein CBR_g23229 [Chara braunii]|eukprot:GBG61714.1 hypothetical protein CBR_g23229 [Chara braunii]
MSEITESRCNRCPTVMQPSVNLNNLQVSNQTTSAGHISRPRQQATSAGNFSRQRQQATSAGHVSRQQCHVSSREYHASSPPAWSMLTRSQTAVMDQMSGETDEAYQARMLLLITEAKQRSDAVATASKKKAEDAEKARLLAIEQQRQHDEAAAKAADEERIQRREKIFSGERALLTMSVDWRAEAENGKREESENKIAQLLSHLTDLLATCTTQQEDIHSLDDVLAQVSSRLQQLKQRPIAAPDASSSNTSNRLEALEIDVGSLKDGVQLQRTATQQLEQRICTAATHSSSEPRETTPRFDDQEIFFDSKDGPDSMVPQVRAQVAAPPRRRTQAPDYGVVAADLHTKISWDDLKGAWHTRFQVELPEIKAMDKLMTFEQGTLPSVDWIAEYQRFTSVPDLQMGFKAVKHYFISRSCLALGNALTHVEDTLTTTAELFDKSAQIIVTNRIFIRPNDRYKSTFKTRYGHFEWVVMPFDLTNAPTAFQAAMANEFSAMLDRFVLVYLDDILVYSRTLEDHLGHLRRVLETLRRAKYKANRDKSEFVRQELEYLGRFVTPEDISPEPIAMNITGSFPKHKTGVDGILSVVDRLTKFAMFLPCRYHAKAPESAEVLYAGWIRTKGYPKQIVCDRDTRFMSDFWLALIKRWGSSLKLSSARHPQTDGQTERTHQTAQVLLRTLIHPDEKDWVERLPDVKLAYNSSIHPAIGMSPFEFEHGSPITSPLDTIIQRTAESDDHLPFLNRMQELLVKARDQMAKTQQRMSQQANRQRLPFPFRVGDQVWVSVAEFSLEQDISRKLLPKWMGPWPIVAPVGDAPEGPSFTIQVPAHLPVYPVFHCSKLVLYTPVEHDDFPGRRSQDPPSMDGFQEVGDIISQQPTTTGQPSTWYTLRTAVTKLTVS